MIPRGFTTLLLGSGLAQVISIAALPILGRLYDPTSFGQLGAVMALVSLSASVVHGRYQLAIPVTKNDDEARALLWLTSGLTLLFSLPFILLLASFVGERPDGLSTMAFLAVATLMTFLTAQIDVFSYWRSRGGRFRVSARNALTRNLVSVVLQIGLATINGFGLMIGILIGTASAACLGWYDALKRDDRPIGWVPLRDVIGVARKYSHFALFGVPQGWLAALSWNAMPLLLLRFDTTSTAGQYWVAYRLLLAPITVFGAAYRQAMLPLFPKLEPPNAQAQARQHALLLALAGIIPMLLLLIYGKPIFETVIGPKWGEAGILAGILSIGILADAFKVPTICLLQFQGKQRVLLIWEAFIVTSRYAIAVPLLMVGETTTAVTVFAIAGAIGWSLFSLVQLWPRNLHLADA